MADQTELEAIEAEQAVLGALLVDPYAISRISTKLTPMHFYRETHRWIYTAMLRLYTNQVDIDMLTVSEFLEDKGYLDKTGGIAYLVELTAQTPTSVHAVHYADIVVNMAKRRGLADLATRMAASAYDRSRPLEELLPEIDTLYYEATTQMTDDVLVDTTKLMGDLYDDFEEAMQRQGLLGVTTGLRDVDGLLGGLHKSDLIYLAARPAVGKTATLLQVAMNGAKANHNTLFISLEMSKVQLAQRMACIESGLMVKKVREGDLDSDQQARLFDAMNTITELPIWVTWTGRISPSELRAICKKHQMDYGIDLLCIDYLQLMEPDPGIYRGRRQEIEQISRALKLLAKELDIPILANAQLSRAVELRQDKRPILSDLRESGQLEQDADIVVFLYRQDMYEPEKTEIKGQMEWIVSKHRNGPTGTVYLMFRGYNNQVVSTKLAVTDGGLQMRMPIDELLEEPE